MKKQVKRTERGWAAHLCVGHRCAFRRNTLLEYNGIKVIVSTVGMYVNFGGNIEKIGINRFYETAAFHAKLDGGLYIADIYTEFGFNSKSQIDTTYKSKEADEMHENVVDEITQGLLNGVTYEKA